LCVCHWHDTGPRQVKRRKKQNDGKTKCQHQSAVLTTTADVVAFVVDGDEEWTLLYSARD
jgi:hypothetical protein